MESALATKNSFLAGVKALNRLVSNRQKHLPLTQEMQLLGRIGQQLNSKMRLACLKQVAEILRLVSEDSLPDAERQQVKRWQQECAEAMRGR